MHRLQLNTAPSRLGAVHYYYVRWEAIFRFLGEPMTRSGTFFAKNDDFLKLFRFFHEKRIQKKDIKTKITIKTIFKVDHHEKLHTYLLFDISAIH